jgi:hypothetical protein
LWIPFDTRLGEAGKSPATAEAAAKTYFDDLNDMTVFSRMKKVDNVLAAYEKSKTDLAAFKATL